MTSTLFPSSTALVTLLRNVNKSVKHDTLMNKINKNLGVIRKLSAVLPCNILRVLYNTLIHPYFNYCNVVWGSQPGLKLDELFIIQKKALRIITKKQWNEHTSPLFRSSNILKIYDLNIVQTARFVYKSIHNNCLHCFPVIIY